MNPSDWKSASNASLLDLVLGFIMPLVVAFVMRPTWPNWFRALATAAVCIVASLVKCYAMGFLAASDILRSILLVMLMCFSFHQNFWKPTGISPAIESATSPTPAPKDAPTDETKETSE